MLFFIAWSAILMMNYKLRKGGCSDYTGKPKYSILKDKEVLQ